MGFSVHWNTTVMSGGEAGEGEGIAWAAASGPEGSFAVNGGGWAVAVKDDGSFSEEPLPLPVYSKPGPNPDYPNYWFVGVPCPKGGNVPGIRAWALVWTPDA